MDLCVQKEAVVLFDSIIGPVRALRRLDRPEYNCKKRRLELQKQNWIISSSLPKIEYLGLWQTDCNKFWTCVYRKKLLFSSTASSDRSGRCDGSIVPSTTATEIAIARIETEPNHSLRCHYSASRKT